MLYTKVEDVLMALGGYSKYQKWLTFALIFPQFPTAMIILSPIFIGSNKVQLLCDRDSYIHENYSDTCTSNLNCTYDETNFQYVSIVQEWNLVCSQSWVADTITSFQMAGMMIGSFVSSVFSDTFGRRKCFIIQTFMMGILGVMPAFTYNPWAYTAARFFAGFGVGACFVVYLSHLMEFLVPSWRTICGTLSFFPLGEMCLALLAYLIGNWRILTFATALPAFFILPFYNTILESPRWLLVKNKPEEAHKVFETIAKWNSKPSPTLEEIQKLQNSILKQEQSALHGIKAMKTIISNRRLLLNLAIETLCVMTNAIVYYGISFSTKNLGGNKYMNIVYMGILDLFASPASILFTNRIGRRKTFMLYMFTATAFMGSIVILQYVSPNSPSTPIAVIALSLCGRFCIIASWGALKIMIMETSPTNLRATCLGFTVFAGYFGGILAPQLVLLGTISPPLPYLILCVMTVSCSIFSWFLSEMVEKPLEDTMENYDRIEMDETAYILG